MEHVLLVVQAILAVSLIGMVLLQRSDSDGFGLGSGGGMNLLSGRAQANLMTRTTAIIAALFIINSLVLSIIAAHNKPASIADTIEQEQTGAPSVPAADADKKPAAEKVAPATETDAAPAEKAEAPAPVKKKAKPAVKPAEVEPTNDADTQ